MKTANHINTGKNWITEKTRKILSLHEKGFTIAEIVYSIKAEFPDANYASVHLRLNRNGIKANKSKMPRKTDLNEDYFKDINTHRTAYFFGLICADGCVSSEINRMRIALKMEDGYLIQELKKEIGSSAKINVYKPKMGGMQMGVQVYSDKMISDLKRHGCFDRKSLTFEMPSIDNKFFGSFLRGYFDGDGWISDKMGRNNSLKHFGVVGSLVFCEKLKERLNSDFNIESSMYRYKGKDYSVLRIGKQSEVLKVRDLMYAHDSISMTRKKEKFFSECDGDYVRAKRIKVQWR